jgi:hypothetical protein
MQLGCSIKKIKREHENVQKVADNGAFCHVFISGRTDDL